LLNSCETLQAVGASFRIFDLLDRQPVVPIEGGLKSNHIDGGKSPELRLSEEH